MSGVRSYAHKCLKSNECADLEFCQTFFLGWLWNESYAHPLTLQRPLHSYIPSGNRKDYKKKCCKKSTSYKELLKRCRQLTSAGAMGFFLWEISLKVMYQYPLACKNKDNFSYIFDIALSNIKVSCKSTSDPRHINIDIKFLTTLT